MQRRIYTYRPVFLGSSGSSGGGARLVLTEQNRHPRVHVSPITMMVAVATLSSPPPQHSPMLGHRASSQTVASFNSRSSFFNRLRADFYVKKKPWSISMTDYRKRGNVQRECNLTSITRCVPELLPTQFAYCRRILQCCQLMQGLYKLHTTNLKNA